MYLVITEIIKSHGINIQTNLIIDISFKTGKIIVESTFLINAVTNYSIKATICFFKISENEVQSQFIELYSLTVL